MLDNLGPEDLSTKINDLFYSNTFSSNPEITKGVCSAWNTLCSRGIKLTVREYFRLALQYLNALGGGILLDILTADEVKEIFLDFVTQLYKNDSPKALVLSNQSHDFDIIDEQDETPEYSSEIEDMRIALENKETDNNVDLLSEKETIKPKHIIGERSSDAISEGQI